MERQGEMIANESKVRFDRTIHVREPNVVGVGRLFTEDKWRDAIIDYVNAFWAGQIEAIRYPRIFFGPVQLELCAHGWYRAFWSVEAKALLVPSRNRLGQSGLYDLVDPDARGSFFGYESLEVGCEPLEVHDGLMRFVRNGRIRALIIKTRKGSRVVLSKTEVRGQYRVNGYQLEGPWNMRSRDPFDR